VGAVGAGAMDTPSSSNAACLQWRARLRRRSRCSSVRALAAHRKQSRAYALYSLTVDMPPPSNLMQRDANMTRGRENAACSATENGKCVDSVRMLYLNHSPGNYVGDWIDCRDLAPVFEHEGPLPHPAQDRPQ
jgi:hypothetical protein